MRRRRRLRLSTQLLAIQALVLLVTSAVGLGVVVHAVQGNLDHEAELRALAIAHSVAADPVIAEAVARRDRGGIVQRRAMAVDRTTDSSFVVVTDDRGIRYAHPNPSLIGREVSTSPQGPLHGRTVLAIQTGTLGRSARAKVPLRLPDGRIVGEVSVGLLVTRLDHRLVALLPEIFAWWAVLLAVGLAGSLLLSRRLKRQTLGLEPGTIADLYREREAVLRDIREGVVAVDESGRLRVANDEAQRLLGVDGSMIGTPVGELGLPAELVGLITGGGERSDVVLLAGRRVLVVNRRPVRREDQVLGAVVTIRDRTDLERLSRELGGVRSVTETLRAQTHEFANRMHVIAGLLALDRPADALSYVREISHGDEAFSRAVASLVAPPLMRALLVAKSAVAAERGVELTIDDDSRVDGALVAPDATLSVLGNLVDNALDAAPHGDGEPPWVRVRVRNRGGELIVEVTDSGPGVPVARRAAVFELGHTSKPRTGPAIHGLGLALVAQIVSDCGGEVSVGDEAGGGAVFRATLPGAITPLSSARDLLDAAP